MIRSRLAGISLRTQLVALLLAVVALVVIVTGLAATAALRSYLLGRVDAQLVATVAAADGGVGVAPAPGGPGPPGFGGRRARRRDVAVDLLHYDASGSLRRSDVARLSLTGGPRVADPGALPDRPVTVPALSGQGSWRVLPASAPGGGTVVAAVSLDGVRDTGARLLLIDAAVGLAALAGAGLLALLAVRRSLAPLVTVESTAEAIAAGDLSRRVPAGDARTEVGGLARSFNAMVDRFESAYTAQQESETAARASEERMRRFVGDASHELRTPLTSIRGFAELFRQGAAREPEQLARAMRRIEDEAARMGLLVEDLLLLARLDQARPLRRDRVDLLAIAADAVHDAQVVHRGTHELHLVPPAGAQPPAVRGDDARLRQVVGNLVTNAVTHTPDGTHVEVTLRCSPGEVELSVCDDGEGMAAPVAERVFERFYRADASRARSAGSASGSGLGLSIVAALVAAHGGDVQLESRPGRGSCFTVTLPAAD